MSGALVDVRFNHECKTFILYVVDSLYDVLDNFTIGDLIMDRNARHEIREDIGSRQRSRSRSRSVERAHIEDVINQKRLAHEKIHNGLKSLYGALKEVHGHVKDFQETKNGNEPNKKGLLLTEFSTLHGQFLNLQDLHTQVHKDFNTYRNNLHADAPNGSISIRYGGLKDTLESITSYLKDTNNMPQVLRLAELKGTKFEQKLAGFEKSFVDPKILKEMEREMRDINDLKDQL